MKHFTSASQITPDFIQGYYFFKQVHRLQTILSKKDRTDYLLHESGLKYFTDTLEDFNKISHFHLGMATFFNEPSTRTRPSFEAAMHRLGGWVTSIDNVNPVAAALKSECPKDVAMIMSGVADVLVVRSHQNFVPEQMSKVSKIPVINAGDGTNEHPTQSLVDMYTVWRKFGKVEGLRYMIVGDLEVSRAAKSLMMALSNFKDVEIVLVASPKQMPDPHFIAKIQEKCSVKIFSEPISGLYTKPDVVYITFPQNERFITPSHANACNKPIIFDKKCLENLEKDAIILNPGPRTKEEMPDFVMQDSRCWIFNQSDNGVSVRMQLLKNLL